MSLISVISKALEAVALNRLLEKLEMGLTGRQYANRRGLGTEHHLLELTVPNSEMKHEKELVYVASINVDGAFGAVLCKKTNGNS